MLVIDYFLDDLAFLPGDIPFNLLAVFLSELRLLLELAFLLRLLVLLQFVDLVTDLGLLGLLQVQEGHVLYNHHN